MDLLRREDGFSLIESLIVILLLGLLVTFTAAFFNDLFNRPGVFLKSEALNLASREINYCINNKLTDDTLYNANKDKLQIKRSVTDELNGYDITVNVYLNNHPKVNIVSLSAFESR